MIYLDEVLKEIEKVNLSDNDDIFKCEHEFVAKEYESQTCGTCLGCNKLIFDDSDHLSNL